MALERKRGREKQNAKNVLTALVKPIVDQAETEYTLVVE